MTEKTSSDPIAQGYYRQSESAISTTQSADKVLLLGDASARHGPRLWQEEARGFRFLRQLGKACTTNALARIWGFMDDSLRECAGMHADDPARLSRRSPPRTSLIRMSSGGAIESVR